MTRWFVFAAAVLACATCGSGPRVPGAAPADALARGDALFAESRYEEAGQAYEEHLLARPDDPRNDRVLLRQALLFLVYGVPEPDPARGERSLLELTARFPASPLREAADYVLALRRELADQRAAAEQNRQRARKLEEQLAELKRIDLERSENPR